MPSSDMWQECKITLQHTRPCYAKSSYRWVDSQTLHGNIHQADHVPNGPANSVVTTMFPLRLCGGKPSVAITQERRYGPSQLRVNDDDVLMFPLLLQTIISMSTSQLVLCHSIPLGHSLLRWTYIYLVVLAVGEL